MSYLYGDSSPSDLESNFIDFLRLALDFSVHVVLSDQRILAGRERRAVRERATAVEVERLEALGETVQRVVGTSSDGGAESPTTRCAAVIARAAAEAVRAELAAVRGVLTSAIADLEADALRERDGCVSALEKLLLRHDLPGTESSVHVGLEGGQSYGARMRGKTSFGLTTLLQLDIPASSLFSHDLKVERIMELEVHTPETGGWLRKETRLVPHKLGKHHVVELTIDSGQSSLKLRAQPDIHSPGFDITIRDEAPRVSITKVGGKDKDKDRESEAAEPYDVEGADETKLLTLYDKLADPLAELTDNRKALVQAALDGQLLRQVERPVVLVERLVTVMAPIVREIAAHSLSPTELVLRRPISADHREEIFVPKAELTRKLEALPESERAMFEPLGLLELDGPTRLDIKPVKAAPARPRDAVVSSSSVPATSGTIAPRPGAARLATEDDWIPIDDDSADPTITKQPPTSK
ncbi:MAG: hypothetical protein IT370_07480 [Deltaproteobacteria bacterium]|nr:hypothetical protein [Deltaproteobacteria bacterium]